MKTAKEYIIEQFEEMKDVDTEVESLVKRFIQTNDKQLLPQLFEIIRTDITYGETNDTLLYDVDIVYRGISLDDETTTSDILDKEIENRYVSTTSDKNKAIEYASNKNHGYLLEYEINPINSIDMRTFNGVSNFSDKESEIIVDVKDIKDVKINKIR